MTPRPASLFLRLLFLALPVESLILLLFGVWLIRGSERRSLDNLDEGLKVQRNELLRHAVIDAEGRLASSIGPHALPPGTRAALFGGDGRLLWETPPGWFEASGLRPSSHEALEFVKSVQIADAECRVLDTAHRIRLATDTEPDVATGPLIEVILARPLADLTRSNLAFRKKAAGTGLALLALTGLLLWAAIRAGLSPVDGVMRRLHAIPGPAGMDRLDERAVPKELRPLAAEINGLLDRLWGLVELEKRFTAEAAHEFRTPVALVKSTLQTALLTGGSREELEGSLREALEDLERLEKASESFLTYARADALPSGQAPSLAEVDLAALLKRTTDRFAPAARERSLGLASDLRPSSLRGEESALERLFGNLLDNAVKYARPGGTILVRCGADGESVAASVEDSGPAIPDEEVARLFQHFYRGSRGRAARVAGAGLGLSIASAIARLHGGELSYERAGAGGNRFLVRFGPNPP